MNEPDEKLMEQFLRIQSLFHRFQIFHFRNSGPFGNPHRGQGRVLSILKIQPEISQKELGYLLDISKQALTELLIKLENNGYITRTQSEEDRRAMIIKLTPKGAESFDEIDDDHLDINKLFGCLNEEEQKNLSDYLLRIIEELESQLKELGIDIHRGSHPHGGWPGGPRFTPDGGNHDPSSFDRWEQFRERHGFMPGGEGFPPRRYGPGPGERNDTMMQGFGERTRNEPGNSRMQHPSQKSNNPEEEDK